MNRKAIILMAVGLAALVIGWLIIFFLVIRLIELTFFAAFFGYGLSFGGFIIGLGGIVHFFQFKKRQNRT